MTDISPDAANHRVRQGLTFGLLAYMLWGLFPIYLKLLTAVPVFEVLSHRILWSVPFGAALIMVRQQWPEVGNALKSPRVLSMLAIAALSISAPI